MTDFPPSLDRASLAAWVKSHTDLPPEQVVMAGPIQVVAVLPASGPTGAGTQQAVVMGEVIDRTWATEHRLVSWRTEVEVDCAAGRVKSPAGTSYSQRRRKGASSAVWASADWTVVTPGDPIYAVVSAVCAPDYPWPLRPASQVASSVQQKPPSALPVAAPAPDAPLRTATRQAAPPSPAAPAQRAPPPRPSAPPPVARTPAPSAPAKFAKGGYAVQVAAAMSDAGARDELAKIAKVLGGEIPTLSRVVTPAIVNGKTHYRAMFAGVDQATARELCRSVSRLGYGCIIRKP